MTISFDDIFVDDELPELNIPPITRTTLALFAGASGDHNPIHIDLDFARAAGQDDVFAHGMLTMAYIGRLLTGWAHLGLRVGIGSTLRGGSAFAVGSASGFGETSAFGSGSGCSEPQRTAIRANAAAAVRIRICALRLRLIVDLSRTGGL